MPIPEAVRSKTRVLGRSFSGIEGFESSWEHGCLSLVSAVCCAINLEVKYASSSSLCRRHSFSITEG